MLLCGRAGGSPASECRVSSADAGRAAARQTGRGAELTLRLAALIRYLNVEEMYGTMCENQRIQCKLITTSNKDPNLKLDGGLMSRIKIQKYESRFVQTSEG